VFFAVTSLFLLATAVGQLGTNTGLVYFLSRARSLGILHAYRPLYRTATRPVLAVATLMALALFVFAPQVSHVVNAEHVGRSTDYLRVMAVFIPVASLENVTLAATRGMGTMRPNVVTEQLTRPGLQLVLVALSIVLLDARGLSLAWAAAYLPAAVIAHAYWRRTLTRADTPMVAPPAVEATDASITGRDFWTFTAPRALASVAQMAMQRLDIVLVAAIAGAVPAAIYTASTRFLVVGQTGQRAVSLAVQPRIGEALALGDTASAKRLYRVSTSWLMLVTWPAYLVFIFFGERLLGLFGGGYAPGRDVLLLL
jgi:O-antigen/teichoic acid export membrane protein